MTPVGVGLAGSGGFDVGVENLNPNRIAASSTSMSGVPTAASLATNGALASGMGMGHSLHGQGQVQPMRRFSGSILPPQQQQQALPQQQYQFQPALEVQVCASFHCFYDFHCLFVFLFFFFLTQQHLGVGAVGGGGSSFASGNRFFRTSPLPGSSSGFRPALLFSPNFPQ